jgi:8-oxo-dGTP pyrophosphatase MutT (NUDIX family)
MDFKASEDKRPVARLPSRGGAAFAIREDGSEPIDVHVASVCVRRAGREWKLLAAKRSSSRALFPGKWECGGGMVRPGEGFDAAIRREIFEEFGLDIERVRILQVYEIHVPGPQRVIPGVRFLSITSEGRVRLNRRGFTSYRWLTLPVRERLDWIAGLKEVVDEVGRMFDEATVADMKGLTRAIRFRQRQAESSKPSLVHRGSTKPMYYWSPSRAQRAHRGA